MKEKTTVEMKLDAMANVLLAENEADKDLAVAQLKKLIEIAPQTPANRNLEFDVRQLLTEIGVPDHVKGSRYLVDAISMCVEDMSLMEYITGELYPLVAEKNGTTGSRVERAIRHAIEISIDRCDYETYVKFFGNTISSVKGKPTNSEFIARLSNVVIMRRAA